MKGLEPIADTMGPLLERLGLSRPDVVARVTSDWEGLVEEPWSTQTRPISLRNGELTLEAVSAGASSLLRYRTGELLEVLDGALGTGVVDTVRIKVAKRPF